MFNKNVFFLFFLLLKTENYAFRPTFLHKVSSQSGSKWREGVDGVAFLELHKLITGYIEPEQLFITF